jgi:hypothetical protein
VAGCLVPPKRRDRVDADSRDCHCHYYYHYYRCSQARSSSKRRRLAVFVAGNTLAPVRNLRVFDTHPRIHPVVVWDTMVVALIHDHD